MIFITFNAAVSWHQTGWCNTSPQECCCKFSRVLEWGLCISMFKTVTESLDDTQVQKDSFWFISALKPVQHYVFYCIVLCLTQPCTFRCPFINQLKINSLQMQPVIYEKPHCRACLTEKRFALNFSKSEHLLMVKFGLARCVITLVSPCGCLAPCLVSVTR